MDADVHMDDEQPAAEVVQAGLQQGDLSDESISINRRKIEVQLLQQYACDGCKCDYGPKNSPCCTSMTVERYGSIQNDVAELTHDELDLVIMAQVMAGFRTEESMQRGQAHDISPQRQQNLSEDILFIAWSWVLEI